MRRNTLMIAVLAAFATLGLTASASAGICSPTLSLVATYGTPVYAAQATFEVHATSEPRGSVGVQVIYEDNVDPDRDGVGRRKAYAWAAARPVDATIKLPGDGRGVANVVKVWALVVGDPRGLTCDVSISAGGALPALDQQCYAGSGVNSAPIEFAFDSPQAAVQAKVAFEARPGAGVSFQSWMTNSVGSERKVADEHFDPWQQHEPQTVVLPRDGLGVYNVVQAKLKMEAPGWYDVLRCSPSIETGGGVSELQSRCFAGQDVEFANPALLPAAAQVTLKTRASNANIAVTARAYRSDGTERSFGKYVDVPDAGLPLTTVRLPGSGTVTDVERFTLRADMVDWPALLTCSPSLLTP